MKIAPPPPALGCLRAAFRTRLLPVALLALPCAGQGQDTDPDAANATLPAVTITSSPLRTPLVDTAQPASVLTGDELARRSAATLGATLSGEPGVQETGFAQGASRPVIRGFDGPRVGVARNGLDMLDVSALSPDHAVASDPLSVRAVEVLRGPATLPYGGSAIGGLVNLIGDEIPDTRLTGWQGEASLSADSGSHGRQGAFGLRGGQDGWNWTAGGYDRNAGDYEIPGNAVVGDPSSASGRLPNSYVRSHGLSVGGSRVAEWGTLGLSHSTHDSRYGIPSDPDVSIAMSRSRTELLGEFDGPAPGLTLARLKFVDSRYRHDEIEGPSGEVGTSFRNRGNELRLELLHEPLAGIRGAFGIQWRGRELEATGEEAYLPGSDESTSALFWVGERRLGSAKLEFGARHEWARLDPDAASGLPSRSFSMNALSAAATLPVAAGYAVAASIGVAARAPVTEELYAYGPHAATSTFEIGDPSLGHERSTNLDLALKKTEGALQWKAGVYANRFRNYLYGRTSDLNGDGLADRVDEAGALANDPTAPGAGELLRLAYAQGSSRFNGVEAEVTLKPEGSPFTLRGFADAARGRIDGDGNVPRMAPARLGLNAAWSQGPWSAFFDWLMVAEQDRVATFETPTDSYQRIDAEIARTVKFGNGSAATFYLQGRNLLDAEIRLHTSFVKDSVPMPGRSFIAGLRARF